MARSRVRKDIESKPETIYDPLRDFEGSGAELWIARFAYNIRNNLLKVLLILATAALALGGAIGFTVWSDYRYEKSLEDFETLMQNPLMIPGAGDVKVASEKLDEYMASHGDNVSELRAELKKIELYRFSSKSEEAAASAEKIASLLHDPDLKAYFTVMAATYLETAGKDPESLKAFEKAAGLLNESSYLKALSLYGVGRLKIRTGDIEEGRKSIRKLIEMEGENLEQLKLEAAAFLAKAG